MLYEYFIVLKGLLFKKLVNYSFEKEKLRKIIEHFNDEKNLSTLYLMNNLISKHVEEIQRNFFKNIL